YFGYISHESAHGDTDIDSHIGLSFRFSFLSSKENPGVKNPTAMEIDAMFSHYLVSWFKIAVAPNRISIQTNMTHLNQTNAHNLHSKNTTKLRPKPIGATGPKRSTSFVSSTAMSTRPLTFLTIFVLAVTTRLPQHRLHNSRTVRRPPFLRSSQSF
ncbi:unnamed protein product, partial [Ilex paraguariensis]